MYSLFPSTQGRQRVCGEIFNIVFVTELQDIASALGPIVPFLHRLAELDWPGQMFNQSFFNTAVIGVLLAVDIPIDRAGWSLEGIGRQEIAIRLLHALEQRAMECRGDRQKQGTNFLLFENIPYLFQCILLACHNYVVGCVVASDRLFLFISFFDCFVDQGLMFVAQMFSQCVLKRMISMPCCAPTLCLFISSPRFCTIFRQSSMPMLPANTSAEYSPTLWPIIVSDGDS